MKPQDRSGSLVRIRSIFMYLAVSGYLERMDKTFRVTFWKEIHMVCPCRNTTISKSTYSGRSTPRKIAKPVVVKGKCDQQISFSALSNREDRFRMRPVRTSRCLMHGPKEI